MGGGVLSFKFSYPHEVTKKAFYCLNDDFFQIFKMFQTKKVDDS